MPETLSERQPGTTLTTLLAAYTSAKERLIRVNSIIGFPLVDWDKARAEARDIYLEAAVHVADFLEKEAEDGA